MSYVDRIMFRASFRDTAMDKHDGTVTPVYDGSIVFDGWHYCFPYTYGARVNGFGG